jgi:hypothetical protein
MCRWGFSNIIKTLKQINDDRLRAYVVWLPIFGGDFRGESRKLSRNFPDKRVTYFSDPKELTGKLWQGVLGLDDIAWDVYMLYGTGTAWPDEPPPPDFWMHQLDRVTKAPVLDQAAFAEKLQVMLKTVGKKLPPNHSAAMPLRPQPFTTMAASARRQDLICCIKRKIEGINYFMRI